MPTRRNVLHGLGAGVLGSCIAPRFAFADSLGGLSDYNVLEIFLRSGVSHRETLWHTPSECQGRWRDIESIDWPGITNGMVPGHELYSIDGVSDVWVSPCMEPLIDTPFWSNKRIVNIQHNNNPHVVAQPYMLGGQPPSRSTFTGSAAVANHRHSSLPYAGWILSTRSLGSLEPHATRTGVLGDQFRPPLIPFDAGKTDEFIDRLNQPVTATQQQLLTLFRDRYSQGLTFPGGSRARSAGFGGYDAVMESFLARQDLAAILIHAMTSGSPDILAGSPLVDEDPLALAIHTANRLIHQDQARYVCVADSGRVLVDDELATRDSHSSDFFREEENWRRHATTHNLSIWRVTMALRHAYDAGTLDPDKTMVVLNTEFGRHPSENLDPTDDCSTAPGHTDWGSDHHTQAFPVYLMGGPFMGHDVIGSVDDSIPGGSVVDPTFDAQHLRIAINAVLDHDSQDLGLLGGGTYNVDDVRELLNF